MARDRDRAAREGWYLFSASAPNASHDEINGVLAGRELPPVSKRTYDHYRRLQRHGYTEYTPINELDVAVKMGRLRQAS